MVNYILRRASYRHISGKFQWDITDLDRLEDVIAKRNDMEMATMTDDGEENIELSSLIEKEEDSDTNEPVMEDCLDAIKISMDFGIAKLISDGVFDSAYILHEVIFSSRTLYGGTLKI